MDGDKAAEIGFAIGEFLFVGGFRGFFQVFGGVVDLGGDDVVLAAALYEVGDVYAEGGDAVFVEAARFAVEVEVGGLFEALEFEEDLSAFGSGGQCEMLAIPAEALIQAASRS